MSVPDPLSAANSYPTPFVWPDKSQLSEFICQWRPQILRVCRNYSLQPADADDILQDVITRILEKRAVLFSFNNDAHFARFVIKTTRGLCLNSFSRRRPTTELSADLPERTSVLADFMDYFPEHLQEGDRIEWLIEQAGEKDRPVLRLRLLEELEYAEMGKRLGCSTTTACERFAKAYLRLERMVRRESR